MVISMPRKVPRKNLRTLSIKTQEKRRKLEANQRRKNELEDAWLLGKRPSDAYWYLVLYLANVLFNLDQATQSVPRQRGAKPDLSKARDPSSHELLERVRALVEEHFEKKIAEPRIRARLAKIRDPLAAIYKNVKPGLLSSKKRMAQRRHIRLVFRLAGLSAWYKPHQLDALARSWAQIKDAGGAKKAATAALGSLAFLSKRSMDAWLDRGRDLRNLPSDCLSSAIRNHSRSRTGQVPSFGLT
jgi:hypothetical protein